MLGLDPDKKPTNITVKLVEEIIKFNFGPVLYANDAIMNREFLFYFI